MICETTPRYRADISAGALKVPETRVIANLLLRGVDQQGWKRALITDNVLQTRNSATAIRLARLIKARLLLMDAELWKMIYEGAGVVAVTERMNKILPRVVSDEFLKGTGIGNEISFYIFDYPPEDELRVREHIRFLLEHIPKQRLGLRVEHINLFDFVLDYLKSRNLLDKVITMQRERSDEAVIKALSGPLDENKIATRFAEVAEPEQHDLVILSGVGSVCPTYSPPDGQRTRYPHNSRRTLCQVSNQFLRGSNRCRVQSTWRPMMSASGGCTRTRRF